MGGDRPIPASDRLVVQVSRWDHLKDMTGVLTGFAMYPTPDDVHLLLVGPDISAVTDDPEGAGVLQECRDLLDSLPLETRARVHLVNLPMDDGDENALIVNALQRHAAHRRAEEPGRGLRADGHRGDVEEPADDRQRGRRYPGPDRRPA